MPAGRAYPVESAYCLEAAGDSSRTNNGVAREGTIPIEELEHQRWLTRWFNG